MKNQQRVRPLAYVTGSVNQELLLRTRQWASECMLRSNSVVRIGTQLLSLGLRGSCSDIVTA
jgi:hypothetical protein